MLRPTKTLLALAISVLVLAVGCSKERPSDELLRAAITKSLKEKGLNDYVMGCGVMKGELKTLDRIEVVAWGEQSADGRYTPVKVHLSGACRAENPRCGADKNQLCPPEDEVFDTKKQGLGSAESRPIVFHLKKGDFDAWTAEPQQSQR